jgi:hypothetical protein
MSEVLLNPDQKGSSNSLIRVNESFPDTLDYWAEAYFQVEVTTSPRSQVEQKRDLRQFLQFVLDEESTLDRARWTPRLSQAFVQFLRGYSAQTGH